MIYICIAIALFSGGIGIYKNTKLLIEEKKSKKAGGREEREPFILHLPTFFQPFIVVLLAALMGALQLAGVFDRTPLLIVIPMVLMGLYIAARTKYFTEQAQQSPEHGLINTKKKKGEKKK